MGMSEDLDKLKISAADDEKERHAEDADERHPEALVDLPQTKEELDAFLQSIPLMADVGGPGGASGEASSDMEAINALIAESTPEDRVQSFKEGGNKAMGIATGYLGHARDPKQPAERRKEFREEALERLRDAVEYYRQALEVSLPVDNPELRSVVLGNRALAHLHLGQLGHCKSDAARAIALNPYNLKAYHRGATAFRQLRQLPDGLRMARLGVQAAERWLKELPVSEKLRIRRAALTEEAREREQDADLEGTVEFDDGQGKPTNLRLQMEEMERQAASQAQQLQNLERAIAQEIEAERRRAEEKAAAQLAAQVAEEQRQRDWEQALAARGIRVGAPLFMDQARRKNSAAADYAHRPYVDRSTGELHWPVLLLYPEAAQSDYIADFAENQSFAEHLAQMFPPRAASPPWDAQGAYRADRLQIEYEVSVKEGLRTLRAQLKQMRQARGLPVDVQDKDEDLMRMLPVAESDLRQGERCVRMQISPQTTLKQVISAQGYEVPGIPVFVVRPVQAGKQ